MPELSLPELAHRLDSRFVRFLLVGGLNTAFGYGFFALLIALKLPVPLAVLISNIGAVLFNFRSTGRLVFGSRDNRLLWRFVANYGVMYALNLAALEGLMHLGLGVYAASALLILPLAIVSFTLNKTFVFREAA